MTTNADAARAYLTERRQALAGEIATLQGRLTEIDYLIAELGTPVFTFNNPVVEKIAHKGRRAGVGNSGGMTQLDQVRAVLAAAGDKGITDHEGAARTGLKSNKVSAMLSGLKARGEAIHETPRYYAPEG